MFLIKRELKHSPLERNKTTDILFAQEFQNSHSLSFIRISANQAFILIYGFIFATRSKGTKLNTRKLGEGNRDDYSTTSALYLNIPRKNEPLYFDVLVYWKYGLYAILRLPS